MKRISNNQNNYWIFGKHAVLAAVSNKDRKILTILVENNNYSLEKELLTINKNIKKVLKKSNRHYIESKVGKNTKHQGVAMLTKKLLIESYDENLFKKNFKFGLLLEKITDPNNVGAIYRAAYSFNVDFIITLDNGSRRESPMLLNSSCGSFDNMSSFSAVNSVTCINNFKKNGWWVLGAEKNGNLSILEIQKKINKLDKILLVLGSEGSGLKRLTKKNCDFLVNIPIRKTFDSLNVSNAAAIFFYEIHNLRSKK